MQSNAYQVLFQPLVIRNLPNQWYVGLGDASWKFDDHKGQYDIPLALRIGKVAKIGKHNWNIFLQPSYTPSGFHKGDEGGIFLGGRDAGGGGGGSFLQPTANRMRKTLSMISAKLRFRCM